MKAAEGEMWMSEYISAKKDMKDNVLVVVWNKQEMDRNSNHEDTYNDNYPNL